MCGPCVMESYSKRKVVVFVCGSEYYMNRLVNNFHLRRTHKYFAPLAAPLLQKFFTRRPIVFV